MDVNALLRLSHKYWPLRAQVDPRLIVYFCGFWNWLDWSFTSRFWAICRELEIRHPCQEYLQIRARCFITKYEASLGIALTCCADFAAYEKMIPSLDLSICLLFFGCCNKLFLLLETRRRLTAWDKMLDILTVHGIRRTERGIFLICLISILSAGNISIHYAEAMQLKSQGRLIKIVEKFSDLFPSSTWSQECLAHQVKILLRFN